MTDRLTINNRLTIAVFARVPAAGQCKTRLIPVLGAEGACALYRCLLTHTLTTVTAAAHRLSSSPLITEVVLLLTPDTDDPRLDACCPPAIPRYAQAEGDLGRRMLAAFEQFTPQGPLIIVGSDCPAMSVADVISAARALRHHDSVVMPVEDGGYALIGLQRPQPALFEHMTWSVATVMAETCRRAESYGLSMARLPMRWDVDRPADLKRLEYLWRHGIGDDLLDGDPAR